MIIVQGEVPIRPGSHDAAVRLFKDIADQARLNGSCLRYDVYRGVSQPGALLVVQEWENLEALSTHFADEVVEIMLAGLPDLLSGEINTRRFEVDDDAIPRRANPLNLH